jgi:hypothetical protein
MKSSPRKTTVTLEDLLRLKRAEQPPAEFWDQFERGLRTKQLAAIVEPRPWWAPFIRVGTRLSRYQLPVGATAVLAITFLTVREYRTADVVQVYEPAGIEVAGVVAPTAVDMRKAAITDSIRAPMVASMPVVAAEVPARPAVAESQRDQSVPTKTTVGSSSHVTPVSSELGLASIIAENLATALAAHPEQGLDQMLGRSIRGMETRPVREEPLAQVSVSGDSRHTRMGTPLPASYSYSALQTNEQTTRHLTENRLVESDVVSRLDVGGDHLGVKF